MSIPGRSFPEVSVIGSQTLQPVDRPKRSVFTPRPSSGLSPHRRLEAIDRRHEPVHLQAHLFRQLIEDLDLLRETVCSAVISNCSFCFARFIVTVPAATPRR